jgi:hypothetical protein
MSPPFVTVPRTGSIGEAFVQLTPCGVTSDCLVLMPKAGTTIEDLFIAAAKIRHEKWRFNYGRKITPSRLSPFPINTSSALRDRVTRRYRRVLATAEEMMGGHVEPVVTKFARLVSEWENGRPKGANVSSMSMHRAYQHIIGMGVAAVPLILAELSKKSGHWFWALHAITGENPVPHEAEGKIKLMTEAWLKWGKEAGYIGDMD